MHRIVLTLGLLLGLAAPAQAHDCALLTGTCAFSEVVAYGGAAAGRLHEPKAVFAAPDGRLAVAEGGARRTTLLDAGGRPAGTLPGGAAAFAPDGGLWVSQPGHLRRHDRSGAVLMDITAGLLRGEAHSNQHYAAIHGVAQGGDGRLFALVEDVLIVWAADGRIEREFRRPTPDGFARDALVGLTADGSPLVTNLDAGRFERLAPDGSVAAAITELPAGAWGPASTFDADGRLYVAGTSETWVYGPDLVRTGVIGRGMPGWGGGLAVTAGTLVFTDAEGDRLRRYDPTGAELPSFGTDREGGLNRPTSIAVLLDGAVVVADSRNRRVVRFHADRSFDRALRDFGIDGAERPMGVAAGPSGDVVATYESGLVERVGPDGAVRASWRVGGDFPFARSVAVAPDGSVWVRDRRALVRFSPDGAVLGRLELELPFTHGSGNGLAVGPSGDLYVALPESIRRLTPAGRVVAEYPASLAEGVDVLPNGWIVVAAQRGVSLLDPDGRFQASWGDHGTPAGPLDLPVDAGHDGRGRLYVADLFGQKVLRFTFAPAGTASPVVIPPAAAIRLSAAARELKVGRSGRVRLRVTCATRCGGTLRLERPGSRARTIGMTRFRADAGRTKTVRVRLRAWARTSLRSKRRLEARVSARANGAAARRTFVLRAARR